MSRLLSSSFGFGFVFGGPIVTPMEMGSICSHDCSCFSGLLIRIIRFDVDELKVNLASGA